MNTVTIGPIPPTNERSWEWFRTFIKQMRDLNNALTKAGNPLLVSINLIDLTRNDFVSFTPHGVDLRTGISRVLEVSPIYIFDQDIKHLFKYRRSKGVEE